MTITTSAQRTSSSVSGCSASSLVPAEHTSMPGYEANSRSAVALREMFSVHTNSTCFMARQSSRCGSGPHAFACYLSPPSVGIASTHSEAALKSLFELALRLLAFLYLVFQFLVVGLALLPAV